VTVGAGAGAVTEALFMLECSNQSQISPETRTELCWGRARASRIRFDGFTNDLHRIQTGQFFNRPTQKFPPENRPVPAHL